MVRWLDSCKCLLALITDSHTLNVKVIIQRFKIPAVCMWLPSRVTQVPFYQEFDFVSHPTVGSYFIDKPFGIVWVAHVVEDLGVPLRKEPIIVGLVPPQQVDVEGRVYSSIFELLRQLNSIIICYQVTRNNSHWSNVFGQELSSLSLRQGKIFGR